MASNDMDRVVPLGQLDDFKVADGEPDVRGWEVLASDGRKIGEVDELLVDTAAMKVRYLDVDVEAGMVAGGHDRHVLIPIGYARLDEARDCVMLDRVASGDLGRIPSYDQGPLTRDFETSVRHSFGASGGAGMLDTAGLDNTPGMGTGLGMAAGGLSGTGRDAADSDLNTGRVGDVPMHSTGSSAGVMSSMDDGLGGGERMGAGSQGPAGGLDREEARGGMGALNERAEELGYDRDAVRMRGDASRSAGLAGSDYMHNSDEDFYASDAFDDAAFYGSRRRGGSAQAPGGSPNQPTGGNLGLSAGTGGADQVDPLSGSGLPRDASRGPDGGGNAGGDRDETRRLAQDGMERLREDHDNRGVGGGGGL